MGIHKVLKFFRPEHDHDKIHAERDGNDSENEVFHKYLEFFAATRIKHERGEDKYRQSDVNNIQHNYPSKKAYADVLNTTTPQFLLLGELENRGLRGSEDRPSNCLRD
jgi:hypothetical protein